MGKKIKSETMADAPEGYEAGATETFDGIEIGADAEFIEPPADLRKKVKQRASRPGDPDPVAAAEAALSRMASSFDGWMSAETQRLTDLWTAADLMDYELEAREVFYRAAHDIKGQAATMGFPVAGRIAASLCRLLDAIDLPERLPRDLVRQHVQSVRAVILENAREDTSATARLLAERLDDVTEHYLDQVSRAA